MADVSNRDEADKCKQIARNALAGGDSEKALRFLQKAKRMCPGDESIDGLIAQAQSGGGSGGSGGGGGASGGAPTSSEGVRQRTAASASSARPSADTGATRSGKNGNYTAEQMQLVQRILRTKDYYDILEVDKNANEDSVKRAYKKLALKLHPDKNKAPGAEEAFKKLSKAVQCLSDEEKKEMYNKYGDEERVPRQHQHYQQDFMTPEDLFAAFFGGGVIPPQRRTRHHEQGGEGGQQAAMFQLMPILLLILLTLASNLATRESGGRFSFARTNQYNFERSTATLNVAYYVTADFEDHYPEGTRTLAEFEQQVEIYHIRSLKGDCEYSEQVMYKKVMLAKRKGSKEELDAARAHPRPACKQVESIKKKYPRLYQAAMYTGMR